MERPGSYKQLLQLCNEQGESDEAIAKTLHTSPHYISAQRTGYGEPEDDLFKKICCKLLFDVLDQRGRRTFWDMKVAEDDIAVEEFNIPLQIPQQVAA